MTAAEERVLLLTCRLGQAVQPLRPQAYLPLLSMPEERLEGEQVRALLGRREAMERYLDVPGLCVVTCLSPEYPPRLGNLGRACPPVLFCRGDVSLLRTRCVSLVGARRLKPAGARLARQIGRLAALEGFTLVSGGASGADRAAQEACLEAGGRVISFLPDALWQHPARRNLLLCSAEGYELPFSAARALERNHFIHALGEVTFVAQCDAPSGGTWEGSRHNLRYGLSPLYVPADGSAGTCALLSLGARHADRDRQSGSILSDAIVHFRLSFVII